MFRSGAAPRDFRALLQAWRGRRFLGATTIDSGSLGRELRLSGQPGLSGFLSRHRVRSAGIRTKPFLFHAGSENSAESNITGLRGAPREKLLIAAGRTAAERHADDFFEKRRARFELQVTDFSPLIVSPFDAELFGHWWFEGPHFLEGVIRRVAKDGDAFRLGRRAIPPRPPSLQVVRPNPSSWGERGFNGVWVDEK